MCPYCGNTTWSNSWGVGNAKCCACNREFNVVSVAPPKAVAIPSEVRKRYEDRSRGFLLGGLSVTKIDFDEVFGEYQIPPDRCRSLVSYDELARWMGEEQEIE